MAFTNKLDTNIVTITPSTEVPGTFEYVTSPGTVELDQVIAYYTYIGPDGTSTTYTFLATLGSGLIVTATYSEIDTILNP